MQFDYKLYAVLSEPYMKKLLLLIVFLFAGFESFAYTPSIDSAARQVAPLTTNIDTLKQMVRAEMNDTVRSAILTQLAAQYLKWDNLDTRTKQNFQVQALYYTYQALHLYSGMSDTLGLCTSFNSLSKIYRSQRDYVQAKWFAAQSNSLSRALKDVPSMMSSLLVLANIKMDIKDYTMAMRDLDEALKISKVNHLPKEEIKVQDSYILLYNRLKNYDKADIAAKRRDFINDSLLKGDQQQVAKTKDSLKAKKKASSGNKKSIKTNSTKRIASL